MKNKYTITTISLLFALMLSGCDAFNSTIPNMTEEQQGMVVEYATETLLHYDRKNGDKIKPKTYTVVDEEGQELTPEELDAQIISGEFDTATEVETTPTPEPVIEVIEDPGISEDDISVNESTEDETPVANMSIAETLGLSGVSIDFDGYDICDYYPEDMQSYFVMNAANGCKLVVLKFKINNHDANDKLVQVPFEDVRYKVSINGNTRSALTTLLLNDLAAFDDVIMAGDYADVVVVGEFKDEDVANISTVDLIIKSNGNSSKFSLY